MKYLKLFENFTWKIADKEYNDSLYQSELDSFNDYYGDEETAKDNLDDYLSTVKDLYNNGGLLYRGLYADNVESINIDKLGEHFTIFDWAVRDILSNSIFKNSFNKGYDKTFVVTIKTPPENISIINVDLDGNPEEFEVNIINSSIIKIVDIKEL